MSGDTPEQTVQEQTPGAPTAPGDDSPPSPPEPADVAVADGDVVEVESDLDELVTVAAERDQYLALAQRTQADFENYRRLVAAESAPARPRAATSAPRRLPPALDNRTRALEAADKDDPLLQGVRLVR